MGRAVWRSAGRGSTPFILELELDGYHPTCTQRRGHGDSDSYLKATRLKDAAGGVYFNLQIRPGEPG
ncbi:unnamed protein product [Gadus morhua 'NCC']